MTHLPAVRHAGLIHEGVDKRALQLQFMQPLRAQEQMAVMAEVGFFYVVSKGPALLPEFPQTKADIVLLRPANGQRLVDGDYTAAAQHFGFKATNGHLAFIQIEDTHDFIATMPLMPQ